ncbi:DNA mismatch repair protein mutl [Heliomicrobium modesticaldum Ice1]|uniref:DNA mismatch repair protein MutL n=1 Tax=Heliobacterium modesticaldum (strain ATCC 51547 / Ice1) TaxID=498761 RepID=MUTL_HELMI|nr:DNA mismatch repair endonuclease MutL [Heliomicrobium modesticaldum]B0TB10.1 RecName: Full=DNA mismatch repair protein MutL [Heliomicrobium modesticaldum Ice1]ABZ85121.1 DNA mismatch repair protein mutl [Heliomicrobium modesticaldum Ice1]
MGVIQRLDTHTVNQIAAGEVVERPASIVKELLENALDAGATRIDITLAEGGKKLIRIIDNGCGMAADDAELCVERHATSKIRRAEDLMAVQTLGFRGEALPSIAAVSRLVITTRRSIDNQATRVRIDGGERYPIEAVGAPPGTTVQVEDLFFNTPARRKFLRSATAEGSACAEVIWRLAAAYPHVAFSLTQGKQISFRSPGNNKPLETLSAVFGREIISFLLPLSAVAPDGWTLRGFIGSPSLHRNNRNHQNWFVNQRWVRCRILSQAVEEAYHGMLPGGRFPFFVLHLELPPQTIDVNSHPTKQEIKFDRERDVADFTRQTVLQTLRSRPLSRPLWSLASFQSDGAPPTQQLSSDVREKAEGERWRQDRILLYREGALSPTKQELPKSPERSERVERLNSGDFGQGRALYRESSQELPTDCLRESLEETESQSESIRQCLSENLPLHRQEPRAEKECQPVEGLVAGDVAEWIPIGQFRRSYILAEGGDTLYLVDQHAAHERVLYHGLKERYLNEAGVCASQQLLLPVTVTLTPAEFQGAMEAIAELRDAGLIVEHFGGNTLLIRAVPVGLPPGEEKGFFRDILNSLMKGLRDREVIRRAALSSMACRGAVKAGQVMSHAEMGALLQQLARLEGVDTCPHGRPYLLRIDRRELERRFYRS